MADKFFIATCEKKVSKHPVKDGVTLTLPVKAGTQTEAKDLIRKAVEELDPSFNGKSETYNDWYKVPSLSKVSEEEYNAEVLKLEASTPNVEGSEIKEEVQEELVESKYPTLGNDGFFNTKDPAVEESSFIYQSTEDNMQAAKVFVLNVGSKQWAYGFRYLCNGLDKHERMNLDRVAENRGDAIDSSISRLEAFLDYQDEFGDDSHKAFLSAVMAHDFYTDFMEPSERFIEAVASHPNAKECIAKHEDFLEVIESDFADIWPLDKSPEQAIEHINSMQLIDVLYDIEVLKEVLKPYLPVTLTEKTKESMKHIEEVIDKPAANDSLLEDRCFKAALPLSEDLHVVIAIKDCGDEGWRYAHEGSLKTEVVFGDSSAFNEDCVATRKDAIKASAQAITDALYSYDSSMSLAKKFMKSPYLQDFEENCVEIGVEQAEVEYPAIFDAITKRLNNRIKKPSQPEIVMCYEVVSKFITENTHIRMLAGSIVNVEKCNVLFNEPDAKKLVDKFTSGKKAQPEQKQEDKKEVVNNEPESTGESKEVATEGSTSKSDNAVDTSDSDDIGDDSVVPSDVVSKEAANDPISVPSIELDENNPNMRIWNAAFKTDLDYTKQNGDRLSINSQYRQMKATAIFGARGKGWGVIVNREWVEEGMPIFVNGEHIGVNESIHNIEIDLWYIDPDTGERHTISSVYGETERWYWSYNYARLIKNTDIRKKSLTDATGKALSMLGICGDVYMGEYDDERIFNRSQATKATTNEIKTMEFDAKTAQLVLDKAKSYTDKFKTAPSLAEIKRLQKLAKTSLDAFPTPDKEATDKKAKAISRIDEQAQEAIDQFNSDKEQQANG
ncbi:hypothetical protein [Vibrio parahaemolyticus]|uniref:hypothetical protein n=1 Tax=Vibrio parahaemolyticus TaxID=670 RepID=UPI000446E97E|nr:hypothetical protein [Vibrio parahaemolyticus]EXJ30700.1 hypothetical protein D050_3576 [Vibrio parahaemolyticus VPCR-2009]